MSVAKKSFLIILISIAIASFFWVRHLRRRLTAIQGAVITRNSDPRKQLPIADVEIGHRSAIVPHLGNIAIRTGHKLRWDSVKEEIVGDPAASAYLARKARMPWDQILKS